MPSVARTFRMPAFLVVALVLTGCSGSTNGGSGAGGSGAGTDVAVTLGEFAVEPVPADASTGTVRFTARNGGSTAHELEVFAVPAGTDGNALSVENHVAVTSGLTLVDEAEEIAPSTSANLTVDLAAGTYVLICNLPAHYESGMHATFTVR